MRSMIRDIVQQSCNLACWVRYHKYDLKESLEEMIDQQLHAAKYIIAMNILMDDAEGSDVGAKAEIYRLILELAKKEKQFLSIHWKYRKYRKWQIAVLYFMRAVL